MLYTDKMKVTFKYDKEKDIWCLSNFGKSSQNSPNPTKTYEQLVAFAGENPDEESTLKFIERYIRENNIDVQEYIIKYQADWDIMADKYQKIAEKVFDVSLVEDVTAYLSVNNRCPYNIEQNFFLVPVPAVEQRKIAMHELWHFYTWYKFGITWEEKIGRQKYNELKEALTVLLNVECKELLPEGVIDLGYPQHQELREKILRIWNEDKNIVRLWGRLVGVSR